MHVLGIAGVVLPSSFWEGFLKVGAPKAGGIDCFVWPVRGGSVTAARAVH